VFGERAEIASRLLRWRILFVRSPSLREDDLRSIAAHAFAERSAARGRRLVNTIGFDRSE
jgi:hypothetical protein